MNMNEPKITINDKVLSIGEAMTIRVILSNEINFDCGEDEHGLRMRIAYEENLKNIRKYIYLTGGS